MSDQIGIWIDRREAHVVRLSNGKSTTVRITSGMESQERRASDRAEGAFEPLQVPPMILAIAKSPLSCSGFMTK